MLNNLLTGFSLLNAGGQALGSLADGVNQLLNGEATAEGLLNGEFGKLLSDANNNANNSQQNQTLLKESERILQNLQNGNANGDLDLDEESLKVINDILSNKPIIENAESSINGKINSELDKAQEKINNLQATQELNSSQNRQQANLKANSESELSIQNNAQKANDLTTQKANDLATQKANDNNTQKLSEKSTSEKISEGLNIKEKEDPRILGKDNIENKVNHTKDNFIKEANEIKNRNGLFSETRGASVSDGINGDEKSADNKLSNIKTDSSELQSPFRTSNENQVRLSSNENQTHKFSTSFNNGEVKVAKIAKNGNIIEVKLDPASYGKIEIKFEFVENTNRANILVLADKSETLEFLRNDSRAIEKILQENGVKSDSSSMHFDLRGGNGQTASDQGQNSDNFRFGRDIAFNIEQEINNQNTNNPMDYLQAANGYYQDKAYQGMVSIVV